MIQEFVNFIMQPEIPVLGLLLLGVAINFGENIFPPMPGDTMLLVLGTLIGIGKVGFVEMLIASTLGSTIGFALMFWFGRLFGVKIIETGRFKFINAETLAKPEEWFRKYGYKLIVANRFLAGTRAVISFFAGMSHLRFDRTMWLSVISSLVWNSILLFAGMELGEKWQTADEYMSQYGRAIVIALVVIVVAYLIYRYVKKKRSK